MTNEERRHCMRLLEQCKDGDEQCYGLLVSAIARHFGYMLRQYNSVDPATGPEDLRQTFMMGVWQAIRKVDHRGDPLMHLAIRGCWAVSSLVHVIHQRRRGTPLWIQEHGEERSIGCIPETWDLADDNAENDPAYVVEVIEAQNEAREAITTILARVELKGRDQDVLDWLLSDEDPHGLGANQRLATELGVSEQRASVLRARVFTKLAV